MADNISRSRGSKMRVRSTTLSELSIVLRFVHARFCVCHGWLTARDRYELLYTNAHKAKRRGVARCGVISVRK